MEGSIGSLALSTPWQEATSMLTSLETGPIGAQKVRVPVEEGPRSRRRGDSPS